MLVEITILVNRDALSENGSINIVVIITISCNHLLWFSPLILPQPLLVIVHIQEVTIRLLTSVVSPVHYFVQGHKMNMLKEYYSIHSLKRACSSSNDLLNDTAYVFCNSFMRFISDYDQYVPS